MDGSPLLGRRDDKPSSADQLLKLAQNPFQSQASGPFVANAFWASLATSLGITLFIALCFSLLRPHVTSVYAPKLKSADAKHAPPELGRGFFAWVTPLRKKKEADLVEQIGLDATVFLRFTRMCRNLFLVMSVIGCGVLIPTNVAGSLPNSPKGLSGFTLMTPLNAPPKSLWAQVVCSWLFDIMVMVALWWNYRAVTRLRIAYFESADYQARLHSRTLMVTEVPRSQRSDMGLFSVANEAHPRSTTPRCSIGRNVRGLAQLIKEHDETVRKLESILAKYLKDPHNLPPNRPTCRVTANEHGYSKGQTVDAINYLTDRIRGLEISIKQSRENIERRDPMPYGFISYDSMPEAHAIAYGVRNKHPRGTTVKLAPTPEDLIWDNLQLSKGARRRKRFVNGLWVALLTVVWIVPNALIAIFLSNLSNLGLMWPAFQRSLEANPVVWAAVQGVAAPAITTLCYFLLPIIFRRLGIRAGDLTKTSRERHVIHNLYAFFVFNNLVVFTAFSAVAQFIMFVISQRNVNQNIWEAIKAGQLGNKLATALCSVSPFWVTWLLQRNLGAAIDLSQVVNLFWIWFAKTFMAPTPRQRYEWTRPPPFDYASYYNYFLFYATVTLCFATLQPLVLPVTALYFTLDSVLKKYLLMYVFVTKNESGGQFWRVAFNRLVFACILANVAIALVAYTREFTTYPMLFSMVPLPFVMLAFKFYCKKMFDDKIHYYTSVPIEAAERFTGLDRKGGRNEKLDKRFGNPAMYKPLITPIVLDAAKDALTMIYRGRVDFDEGSVPGHRMDAMSQTHPGRASQAEPALPFGFVGESHLDFSNAHNRAEFGDDYGSGAFYGRPIDLVTERSDTPHSFATGRGHSRSFSTASASEYGGAADDGPGVTYPANYHRPSSGYRSSSPASRTLSPTGSTSVGARSFYAQPDESETHLLYGAGGGPPGHSRSGSGADGRVSGGWAPDPRTSYHGSQGPPMDRRTSYQGAYPGSPQGSQPPPPMPPLPPGLQPGGQRRASYRGAYGEVPQQAPPDDPSYYDQYHRGGR
ncbi:MAG: Transmembrane protein 63C [Thelocarpon impressellum]|nr:MAG: Transmembrane protein 63C [Thelocarpon impressellum]